MTTLPWGITIGDIVEVVFIILSVVVIISAMRYDIRTLKHGMTGLAQRQEALESRIGSVEKSLQGQAKAILEQFVQSEREIGETVMAIRERVTQVELYMRDNFVRKETFNPILAEIRGELRGIGSSIEARLLRMESKIDVKAKG